MRRQHTPISIFVISLLVLLVLVTSVAVTSPADADNSVLSSQPTSEPPTDPPQETTVPTVPTDPTEPQSTEPAGPTLESVHAFVYDCRTGKFLYQTGDVHEKLYPASITKLFSAYVALLHLKPTDTAVVGDILDTLPSDSSKANLNRKDRLSVADLVAGMLLPSGGDAARVLAVAAGKKLLGTTNQPETVYYEAFVDEMNRQAAKLSLKDSHFENPDGYHDPNHYISLADAARLGALCLNSTLIMQTVQSRVYWATVQNTGRDIKFTNTNQLLFKDLYPEYYHPQAIGFKTGFTSAAGNCLLSAFQVEGGHIIIGVFGCDNRDGRYRDTLKLFDFIDT